VPGARPPAHPLDPSTKSVVLESATPSALRLTVPPFPTVMFCADEVTPRKPFGNERVAPALRKSGDVPEPTRFAVVVVKPLPTVPVTTRVAILAPDEFGANDAVTVQVPPAASDGPQVFELMTKSAVLGTATKMPDIVAPVLVTTNIIGPELAPSANRNRDSSD
jgi:hypothetical protein